MFLLLKKQESFLYDPRAQSESLFLPFSSTIKRLQQSNLFLDIELESGEGFSFDIKSMHYGFESVSLPGVENVFWRRVQKTDGSMEFLTINERGELCLERLKEKLGFPVWEIVGFEIVNAEGKMALDGEYIVVVGRKQVQVYEKNTLKKLRTAKFDEETRSVTFTDWGSLLVLQRRKCEILVLPDVSAEGRALPIGVGVEAVLIPGRGVITICGSEVTLFTPLKIEPIVDEKRVPLVEPPLMIQRGLGGGMEVRPGLSLEEIDRSFKFRRQESAMGETTDVMQKLLVKAHERTDKLSEMEKKGSRLVELAKNYRAKSIALRKGN
jgi:hypothetical protein